MQDIEKKTLKKEISDLSYDFKKSNEHETQHFLVCAKLNSFGIICWYKYVMFNAHDCIASPFSFSALST